MRRSGAAPRWARALLAVLPLAASRFAQEDGVLHGGAGLCVGGPSRLLLNFVSHSNLEGKGPDQGKDDLVFGQVTHYNGHCIELQVTAPNPQAAYTPQNAKQNGAATDPHLGRLNMMSGHKTDFLFSLLDCETKEKIILPHFNFTIYAVNVPSQREITVVGYRAAYPASADLFEKEYTDKGTTFKAASPCSGAIGGQECALTFYFNMVSEIPVTLNVPGVEGFGHLFYFSSSLCNAIRLPYGHCMSDVCGPDFQLRSGSLGRQCMGEMCSEHECCQLKPEKIMHPLVQDCNGKERQWRSCPELPECNPCIAENCMFDAWSPWKALGGCTGLCVRDRHPGSNNECGNPCSGPTQETVVRLDDPLCYPFECHHNNRDCVWNAWAEWTVCHTECGVCMLGQRYRSRAIYLPEVGRGVPCTGPSNETEPCEASHAIDCELSQWAEWTACSKPCGMGWRARMRRTIQNAQFGGKSCGEDSDSDQGTPTRQTEPCNKETCGGALPCILSDWSLWDGCSHSNPYQKFRYRDILQSEMNGGTPCDVALNQTAGCPEPDTDKPLDACVFNEWAEWSHCSATCGGQKQRSRKVMQGHCVLSGQASRAGTNLMETVACGVRECNYDQCHMSEWTAWDTCSAECGMGVTQRSRKILEIGDTSGCNVALEEVRGCLAAECSGIDCVWGQWDSWGACTISCDGGIKTRNRIIEVAPRDGGRLCSPEAKSEVGVCNSQKCDACTDGKWSDWGNWGSCSSTCSPSYRVRHRNVAVHPNECGKPASGLEDEFQLCDHLPKCTQDVDCSLSAWGTWSDCSNKCYGVRERQRNVAQFARGEGKSCSADSLKEVAPCNPALGEPAPGSCSPDKHVDCVMGSWEQWTTCTASCDGGQMTRSRHILSPASHSGRPCIDVLGETQPCHNQPCAQEPCMDCLWAGWSEWGDCTKCGGQRFRHRAIERLPNLCGKKCDATSAKELGSCESHCEKPFYCAWTKWESMGTCSNSCGSGTFMRQRQLSLSAVAPPGGDFFVATADSACSGSQITSEVCDLPSCNIRVAEDCEFNLWSEWSAPTCTQLCERQRTVRTEGTGGGAMCEGHLIETKRCPHDCSGKRDCILGAWGAYQGDCQFPNSQRQRHRNVVQTSMNGGKPCEGAVTETISCGGLTVQDCQVGDWAYWSACTSPCDGGTQWRQRSVQLHARGGGNPCADSLYELNECNMEPCAHESKNCLLSQWDGWTSCQDASMKFRFRRIERQPVDGGKACVGALREAGTCLSKVDCEVSGWTEWDGCDATCGGGQRTRQRQVTKNPTNGGGICPESLIETQGCNAVPCETRDCTVSTWTAWAGCSVSCGLGYRNRNRDFTQRPCVGGRGCDMDLAQTEPCFMNECVCRDCLWADWAEWNTCDKSCDGGQSTRARRILVQPEPGCKACDSKTSEQVKPCNTFPCGHVQCVDGQFGDWSEWGVCSASCLGGETWRTRKIVVEASECGLPPTGLAEEARKCNYNVPCVPNVDCQFAEWGRWSECSGQCEGVRERSRSIVAQAKGDGLYCQGSLKQTAACHNGGGLLDFQDPTQLLSLDTIMNNNLGGRGPWGVGESGKNFDNSLEFRNVAQLPTLSCLAPDSGTCAGRVVNLRVEVIGDVYKACNVQTNGRHGHNFGEISVGPSSIVQLRFRLLDALTGEDVRANKLMLKLFSLTQDQGGLSQMQVVAKGFKDYFLTKDTSVAVASAEEFTTFAASNHADNAAPLPESPSSASAVDESRSIAILFDYASEARVNLQVRLGDQCRPFLFAAKACFGTAPCEVDPCGLYDKPPVDCVVSKFGDWSTCDAECGVGQQTHKREIVQMPTRGGFGCSEDLTETRECIQKPCHDERMPVDCQWDQWGSWSGCDRCGGEMRRERHIAAHPQSGGMACARANAVEITKCPRNCRDKSFCVWDEWTAYGMCTSNCGSGLQSRLRYLKATSQISGYGAPVSYLQTDRIGYGMEQKFEELNHRATKMETSRLQVLATSFGAGVVSLAAVLGVVRAFSATRAPSRSVIRYDSVTSA